MAASVEDNERPTAKSRLSPTWQTLANSPSKLSGTTRSEFRFYPKLQGGALSGTVAGSLRTHSVPLVSLDLLFLSSKRCASARWLRPPAILALIRPSASSSNEPSEMTDVSADFNCSYSSVLPAGLPAGSSWPLVRHAPALDARLSGLCDLVSNSSIAWANPFAFFV